MICFNNFLSNSISLLPCLVSLEAAAKRQAQAEAEKEAEEKRKAAAEGAL